MKQRMAVIAQTADPAFGSEFATGWAMINKICAHPLLLERFDLDIFVSKARHNDQRILETGIGGTDGLHLRFVPLIWPPAHRFAGKILRILWQFKVAVLILMGKYDAVFQVSPNSIVYANPLLFFKKGPTKLVGPMRIEPRASVSGLYWRSGPVLMRHLAIKAKEAVEWIALSPLRAAIKRNAALHVSPFVIHVKQPNQFYCRETALIELGEVREDGQAIGYRLLWSGQGDPSRKNEHLARSIIDKLLDDPRFDDVSLTVLGATFDWQRSERVSFVSQLPRAQLLHSMTARTIYLCTSLLELNSVLAEEVLIMGGAVVGGPLPGLLNRPDSSRIATVINYGNPSEWLDKIAEAIGFLPEAPAAPKWRDDIADRLVERILAAIPSKSEAHGSPCF